LLLTRKIVTYQQFYLRQVTYNVQLNPQSSISELLQ
jgi:hypothetical protein